MSYTSHPSLPLSLSLPSSLPPLSPLFVTDIPTLTLKPAISASFESYPLALTPFSLSSPLPLFSLPSSLKSCPLHLAIAGYLRCASPSCVVFSMPEGPPIFTLALEVMELSFLPYACTPCHVRTCTNVSHTLLWGVPTECGNFCVKPPKRCRTLARSNHTSPEAVFSRSTFTNTYEAASVL